MKDKIEQIIEFLKSENIEKLTYRAINNPSHPYSHLIIGNVEHNLHMKFSSESLLFFLKHKLQAVEVHSETLSTEDEVWFIADNDDLVIHLVNDFVRTNYKLDTLYEKES